LTDLRRDGELSVRLEVETDEQWSHVEAKSNQRWCCAGIPKGTSAIDHATNTILAYVFGKRTSDVFKQLKALLNPLYQSLLFMPFGYTDDWGAYSRHLDTDQHEIGQGHTHKIERKNLNFRTWITQLARKTICFSKLEVMHESVIGLLINKVEFGRNIFIHDDRFHPLPPTVRLATAAFLRRVIAEIF